jgi:hypothetical protein
MAPSTGRRADVGAFQLDPCVGEVVGLPVGQAEDELRGIALLSQ